MTFCIWFLSLGMFPMFPVFIHFVSCVSLSLFFYGQKISILWLCHRKCVHFPVFNFFVSCDGYTFPYLELRGQFFRGLLVHFPVSSYHSPMTILVYSGGIFTYSLFVSSYSELMEYTHTVKS